MSINTYHTGTSLGNGEGVDLLAEGDSAEEEENVEGSSIVFQPQRLTVNKLKGQDTYLMLYRLELRVVAK